MSDGKELKIYNANTSPIPLWLKNNLWQPQRVREQLPWISKLFPLWRLFDALQQWPVLERCNQLFQEYFAPLASPVVFVPNPPKQRRRRRRIACLPYDSSITLHQQVYTRDRNWHDFFNLMIWSILPQTKAALHRRQHQAAVLQAGRRKDQPVRNAEQNNLTRFDEGGLILICATQCFSLLPAPDEADFVAVFQQLSQRQQAALVPMGHAVFETMLADRWQVGAMSYMLLIEQEIIEAPVSVFYEAVDALLAAQINGGLMCDKGNFFGISLAAAFSLFASNPSAAGD